MQSDNNENGSSEQKPPAAKTGAAIENPTSAADEKAREKARL